MNEFKKWDEAESIQLIREMMENTRQGMYSDRFLYLMWGYLTLVCAASHYVLRYFLYFSQPYLVWFCMPVAAVVHVLYIRRSRKLARVKTYADRVLSGIWGAMGLGIIAVLMGVSQVGWEVVYPFFMLLYGMASFATGMSLRYNILVWGGLISIACGIFSFYWPFQFQLLALQIAIIASFIIPAHFMNNK